VQEVLHHRKVLSFHKPEDDSSLYVGLFASKFPNSFLQAFQAAELGASSYIKRVQEF